MLEPRPALLHPEIVLALPPERAHALLVALRAPRSLVALARRPVALARALFASAVPERVAHGFHHAVALASRRGRDALLEGRFDVDRRASAAWEDETPPELAATAVAAAACGDTTWQRAIDRAFIRLARVLPSRVGYEHCAREPFVASAPALEALLARLPGTLREPWVTEDPDGTLHAAVFWAEGSTAGIELDGRAVRRRVRRKVRVDLVTVEPAKGRVRLLSARPERSTMLAEAIAAAGWAELASLVGRPAFTLKPLLVLGPKGIARAELPAGVEQVTVVACQLVDRKGERTEERSKRALRRIREVARARGGYLHRATFRFTIAGAPAPVDAYVELPNVLGVRDARHTRTVRAALAALGVMSPGAIGDDVATLSDWVHAAFRWTEVVGEGGFARMVELGLLAQEDPAETPGVALPNLRPWGHTLRAFPLPHSLDAGRSYALADDPNVRPRSVGPEERRMWRLDLARLAHHLRTDLGLAEGAPLALPAGVLDVGVAPSGARVVYAMQLVPDEDRAKVADAIALAVAPAPAVVLVPRGRALGGDRTVELDLPEQLGLASARAKLAAALADAGGPAPAEAPAPTEALARVALSIPGTLGRGSTDVEVNGVTRSLQNARFAVLLRLVAAHGRAPAPWLSHAELGMTRAPHAVSRIRTALRELLPRGFELIECARKAYRLNPALTLGAVGWGALAEHPDPAIRSIGRRYRPA